MSSNYSEELRSLLQSTEISNILKKNDFATGTKFDESSSASSDENEYHTLDQNKRLFKNKAELSNDMLDQHVVRYGASCSIRGSMGKYLSSSEIEIANSLQGSVLSNTSTFILSGDGQGSGEGCDCLQFVNIDDRDDRGPLRYGNTVAVKAIGACSRFLGLKNGQSLGFWRNLIGQMEKWEILRSSHGQQQFKTDFRNTAAPELLHSRGGYIRLGDGILLQAFQSELLVTLYEGIQGVEVKVIQKDRATAGSQTFTIEPFASVPIPKWIHRPYLRGTFLAIPPQLREPSSELLARTFPVNGKGSEIGLQAEIAPYPPKLFNLDSNDQQTVLIRDLLLILSGLEGTYIKVSLSDVPQGPSLPIQDEEESDYLMKDLRSSISKLLDSNRVRSNVQEQKSRSSQPVAYQSMDSGVDMKDIKYQVSESAMDRSLANQVRQLVAIGESYVKIKNHLVVHSQYEYGAVSHAFCAAVRLIVREYEAMLAQLEHIHLQNRMTMQKMWYLLQGSGFTLKLIERLCSKLTNRIGGALLDALHHEMLDQGDSKARALYHTLLEKSYEPFLRLVEDWIYRGELNDPYREFMIHEDTTLSQETLTDDMNSHYWDRGYTLAEEHVPMLLKPFVHKALNAGKYLHMVLDCCSKAVAASHHVDSDGRNTVRMRTKNPNLHANFQHSDGFFFASSDDTIEIDLMLPTLKTIALGMEELPRKQSPHDVQVTNENPVDHVDPLLLVYIGDAVEEAYTVTSQTLLTLLQEGHGLSIHLQSLSRFFLLEHGDFFIQFMDTAEDDLRKEVKDISVPRLKGLLNIAVQTSTLNNDVHRDKLSCSLAKYSLIQHIHLIQSVRDSDALPYSTQGLKGVEALTLEYSVDWPLSIVLSKRAITKYQLLSRLLYFSKHVERRLLSSWIDHQRMKDLDIRGSFGMAYMLRHRMLHFLQNFVYYITVEVINPHQHELRRALQTARDLDELLSLHEKFLNDCLRESLLSSQDLLKILTKLMVTCLLFADQMIKFSMVIDNHQHEEQEKKVLKDGLNPSHHIGKESKSGTISWNREVRRRKHERFIQQETNHDSFHNMLNKFSTVFDDQIEQFLSHLWTDSENEQHAQLTNLCARLDYNGFYSERFASST